MEILIIIALIIGGLILFAIEVFLIPGVSLAGIASGISILYAIYYAFETMGAQAGGLTIAAAILGLIGVIIWFMRSHTVDKLSLKSSIDYRPDPLKDLSLHVGDQGITVTRLTLIGNASFNGEIIEVQSLDGFIEEQTPITVSRIKEGRVYVKRVNKIIPN